MDAEGYGTVYGEEEVVHARVLISAAGGLLEPNQFPDLPGLDKFQGEVLHTARWNETIDLDGKNVVVVGSGCSAA